MIFVVPTPFLSFLLLLHFPSSACSPQLPLLRKRSTATCPYRRRRPADVRSLRCPARPMTSYKCSTADHPCRRRRPADVRSLRCPAGAMTQCKCSTTCFFPSSVFRQVISAKCFPSSVFREVFSVKCFPSRVFCQFCSSDMFVSFETVGFSDSKVILL